MEHASIEASHKWLGLAMGEDSPFPWQTELLRRFVDGDMPSALDIPTGLGKTAVMAIWLAARAAGAKVPRRLVYVVDRRAVVDQATKVAEDLRARVEGNAELKRGLQLDGKLPISTLRGQFVDNREWLGDPSSPAIVLGTVDMVGSRLLFQGYGVSRKMRPYHAGLLGSDTLLVLDEAHLVAPFERLIEAIASDTKLTGVERVPKVQLLSLSATGRPSSDAMTLGAADYAHEIVDRRLKAEKCLELREAVERKELPGALATEALAVVNGRPLRCIVFCDSREDAQKVHEELTKRGGELEAQLFVGGRRVHERAEAAVWLAKRGFIAGSKDKPAKPTFVVATSAGEVGVDLDADHMVSDLVAWERMVQRLGRVNRRGDGSANIVVIPAAADAKTLEAVKKYEALAHHAPEPKDDSEDGADEDEGEGVAADDGDETKKEKKLKPEERSLAERQLRIDAARSVIGQIPLRGTGHDASPGALTTLRRRAESDTALKSWITRATTPEPLRPALTRPLVEAWSMTSLETHTARPEVAPWLRGWIDDEKPQTTIIWREHLPVDSQGKVLGDEDQEIYFDAAPPHPLERLETETWRVVEWLTARIEKVSKAAGTRQEKADPPTAGGLRRGELAALVRRDEKCSEVRVRDTFTKDLTMNLTRQLAGATLIVDVRLGGLSHGLLDDESDDASDVTGLESDGKPLLPFRVRRQPPAAKEAWREEARLAVETSNDEVTAWLVIESDPNVASYSEEGRSTVANPEREQLLQDHEEWAETAARRIAERLTLAPEHRELLALAARLHDEGKKARRWQLAFKAPSGGTYAKTTGTPNFKLLDGYRHEFGSLPYAERDSRVAALSPDLRDLCLHLIASHHGYARPVIRTAGAEEPPSLLEQRAQDIALRFTRMEKQWGPWGLAWWEALLRAADQQASRQNDQGGTHG